MLEVLSHGVLLCGGGSNPQILETQEQMVPEIVDYILWYLHGSFLFKGNRGPQSLSEAFLRGLAT